MLTPEEAQKRTEGRFEHLSGGSPSADNIACGWCMFAHERQRFLSGSYCHLCPLNHVFEMSFHPSGCNCHGFAPFSTWDGYRTPENAAVLYRLLVDNREKIIAEAYRILEVIDDNS